MAAAGEFFSRLDKIYTAAGGPALDDAMESAVADFGGISFSMGLVAIGDNPTLLKERGQSEWIRYYHGSGLFRSCGFSRRAMTSLLPFTWDEAMAADQKGTADVAAAARTYGLRHGLHVPVITRKGRRGAVFIQTREGELHDQARQALNLYALAAFSRMEQIEGVVAASDAALSPREAEVLKWFAEGKTAEDVGSILDLSPATVMYHYRSVADRYGTLNRTHTVVEALRRGELQLQ